MVQGIGFRVWGFMMGIGRLGIDQKPDLEGQGDLVSRFIGWISRVLYGF